MLYSSFMSRKVRHTSLVMAIREAGGLKAISEPCGVSEQAVCQWDKVPPKHVLTVERVSGISRHQLRPDLYPLEDGERKSLAVA